MADAYDRKKEVKEFDESKVGVKGLSDSGIETIPRLFVHPPEKLTGVASPPRPVAIPVVDISGARSPDLRQTIVARIREAAADWGFFQVTGHGVPLAITDAIVAAIRGFHELPHEIKSAHYSSHKPGGVTYSSNHDLLVADHATWHDYVSVWMSPADAAPPTDQIPEAYRSELAAWDEHAAALGHEVAELLSEGLGLGPKRLEEASLLETRIFGGLYYPYCPQPDLTVGLSGHTDPGVLTLFLPNRVRGLQVKRGEEWMDVEVLPDALICNIGDFLQIVSNGEYKSVEHRVLANAEKAPRITVVHWFDVGNWKEGEQGPLPELVTPERPSLYRRFSKQQYEENYYSKGLDSKSLVEKLML